MVGPCRLLAMVGVLAVLTATAGACSPDTSGTLTDIPGVETLRQQFNADAGKPRVVLLLSPT